ncbi:MGMT family protein [Planococcus sp. YIM B11945]|uniref:MGMT family protein n=1 Tax=Planococcus sp. YIM B11945 TaxID=3435410 RepID=UPI003D7E862B
MEGFTERAIDTIKNVPSGKVMTYGQVAAHAGSPRAARQIARILHSMSAKHELPWHRIINAQGKIVLNDEESRYTQRALLIKEGIKVSESGFVDLNLYRHDPFGN